MASGPISAASWRSALAPLAYVMADDLVSASAAESTGDETGWAFGRPSARYADALLLMPNSAHAVSRPWAALRAPMHKYVASASASHKSSHQRPSTRQPNHRCAASCARIMSTN